MTLEPISADIPSGFLPARSGGPFVTHNGTLYARWTGERLLLGFRVLPQHTNPMNVCHGGMLATFADMLMPMAAIYQMQGERHFLPTISLNIDYLAPSPLGAWVQGQADVLRTTRNLVFAQGLVTADGEPALRVNGIFKVGPVFPGDAGRDPFGLLADR
ncbi:MAG: PaaI family thioesterase [Burkholderiaceae bacterium]|nr:MAG: PaaI family thioesterase [Burkholderiaceae bacterium]